MIVFSFLGLVVNKVEISEMIVVVVAGGIVCVVAVVAFVIDAVVAFLFFVISE